MRRCLLPAFSLKCRVSYGFGVHLESLVTMVTWRQTLTDEARTEDWCEGPADVVAKGEADGTSAGIRNPVALSCESTPCDRVGEIFKPWV